jgi:hypothetical protein
MKRTPAAAKPAPYSFVPTGFRLGSSASRPERRAAAVGFMVLSRLACILIRVYASQVAAAQPTATARSKPAGGGPRIETVRGVGYRIVAS